MSLTLRTIRFAPRKAVVAPVRRATPPVPRTAAEAEPYRPAPEPGAVTVAHRRHRLREALARARNRLIQWREEAIREAWANGYRGGRTAERAEIQAELRSRLQAGHYDLRDGNGAARMILAYLAEDSQ